MAGLRWRKASRDDDDPVHVGSFKVLGLLGAGGMGRVYLGRSPSGLLAAIKIMHPELAADAQLRRRFAREVAAAQRVSGAFTASVIDADADGAVPWMATQYIQGPTLQRLVDRGGPLPVPTAARLGAGIAEALKAIHAVGLVHRDLKPGNVLITAEGPKVIDFGISRADGQTLTQNTMVGTPAYMSPEQITTPDQVGPASDVFALGSVLAFAVSGASPFAGGDAWSVMHRINVGLADLKRVPRELSDVVQACLAVDVAVRPTPGQIILALADQVPHGEWLPPTAQAVITLTVSEYEDQFTGGRRRPDPPPATPTPTPAPTAPLGRPKRAAGLLIIDATPPGIRKPAYVDAPGGKAPDAPKIQTEGVIARMRRAGPIAAAVMDELGREIHPGVTTNRLDDIARTLIYGHGAYPSMLGYKRYDKSICASVNDCLVNGRPNRTRLRAGDIVGISLGVYYGRVHVKVARTFAVGRADEASTLLLAHAQVALTRAVRTIMPGRQMSVIGRAIEATARRGGYGVVRDFCGHGLSTEPFNDLHIVNYDDPESTSILEPGHTFTVHPILTLGDVDHVTDGDGWSIRTTDGRRSAEAMHTVLVTETGPEILTEMAAAAPR